MERDELLEKLRGLNDLESAHTIADGLLVEYINDAEIAQAYNDVPKWWVGHE